MKSLLVVGAGGYGRLVKEIAQLNGYERIDFLDDNSSLAVGKIAEVENLEASYDGSIVAIGNPKIREEIIKKLKKPVTLVHPSAVVSISAAVECGCVIEAHAVVNSEAIIGKSCFICAGSVVNHNASVGNCCQIDCNATVSCGARVANGTKVESCTVYRRK